MSVFLLLGCEMVTFSLLLGAYMESLGLGFVILGGCALVIYPLFQRFYSLYPYLWMVTFLGSLTTLLWTSFIDFYLGTTFIAMFLCIIMGIVVYSINYFFVKKNYGVMLK